MNEEQKVYWWTDFCNSCMNEDCLNCEIPVADELNRIINNPSGFKEMTR